MWWFLCKKNDNENEIVYSYGRETKEQTGEIKYNKENESFEVIKLAENDTLKGASILFPHLYRVIYKENCPEQRLVAIG